MLRRLLLTAVAVAALVGAPTARADPPAPPGTPTATRSTGTPTVGPLFPAGLDQAHTCTGAVLDTPDGNLLITAAHCVVGSGVGMLFAPGYLGGRTPYGVWTVQRAWAMPSWLTVQAPQGDIVLLQVAAHLEGRRRVTLQSVTGGLPLGQTRLTGLSGTVTTVAYGGGRLDAPVSCTAPLGQTQGYPTFNCHGYPDGSSGGPFLLSDPGHQPVLVGVIGGLHQGGCYEWNSFSAPFTLPLYALLARAGANRPADVLPPAGPDGC